MKEPARKHYALESRLGTAKRQFAGYLFVFPYYSFDRAKLLLRTQSSASYFLFDPAQPVTNTFVNP
jgi:hypothetical protein